MNIGLKRMVSLFLRSRAFGIVFVIAHSNLSPAFIVAGARIMLTQVYAKNCYDAKP